MKVLIPAAGRGTRLRPHTLHRPKPLLHVAGSTVLGHVLDKLRHLDVDEIVFIIGHLGNQIKHYVTEKHDLPARFVVQEELRGQAHAIALARRWMHGPVLILFVDTIFETDLTGLDSLPADGVIFVSEVDDPRRFGIVTVGAGGQIAEIEEKPDEPRSNLAIAGLYYVRDAERLLTAIDHLMARNLQTKGEFYLADALQLMITEGARFLTRPLSVWEDCGTPQALLRSNRYLLERLPHVSPSPEAVTDSVLIPPVHVCADAQLSRSVVGPYVFIGSGCRIDGSVVGPHVSLADDAKVTRSVLRNAIVDAHASVADTTLDDSLIGVGARILGHQRLNVGDASEVGLSGEPDV